MNSEKRFDVRYRPHPEYRFWLYDPQGDGMTYYRTAQERDAAAEITVRAYLDDGWDEEVELVAAGEVTHSAQILNKQMRPPPEELDEEGCDGEGTHWPAEFEWRGTYKLEPLNAVFNGGQHSDSMNPDASRPSDAKQGYACGPERKDSDEPQAAKRNARRERTPGRDTARGVHAGRWHEADFHRPRPEQPGSRLPTERRRPRSSGRSADS